MQQALAQVKQRRGYRFRYQVPGAPPMHVNGTFRAIDPPSRLAFSWNIEPPDEHAGLASPGYLLIETGFTIVQWLMVGPLIALALRQPLGSRGGGPERVRACRLARCTP